MEGFIVFDYEKEYPRALKDLAQWLAEGKIKRKETIVKGGLQNAESALRDLYEGRNTGKHQPFFRFLRDELINDRENAGGSQAC